MRSSGVSRWGPKMMNSDSKKTLREAEEFQSDAIMLEAQRPPFPMHIVWFIVVALLFLMIIWASFAKVDKIVTADGKVATGTMPNNGAVSKTLDANTPSYTIPKGYHSGAGKVSVAVETKTVTPAKAAQDVVPSTGRVLTKVSVAAIPEEFVDTSGADALAANILDGKTAFVNGVKLTGSMPDNGSATATMDGLTTTSVTIPAGYTAGGTVSLTSDIEEALAAI